MNRFRLLMYWMMLGSTAQAGEYRVGAGDLLEVQVREEVELSGEVQVTDACTVSLALIGRIEVCGLTPGEIEARVEGAYQSGYLLDPAVAVRVLEHRSQRVDVLGEVQKRGPVYLQGPTSLVEVISAAGGPAAENVVDVEVISAAGESVRYDLRAITASAAEVLVRPGDKIVLRPGKVVYIEGQLKRPGEVTLRDGLTVTQALALAGGPDEFANLRRVILRRADGEQLRVNVPRVHRGLDPDLVLRADDHIVVPRGSF